MHKTLLASSLLIILSSSTYANNAATPAPTPAAAPVAAQATAATTPAVAATPAEQPATVATKPAPLPATIDCHYPIPPTTLVSVDVVTSWAEKAVMQAFDYNNSNIDSQLLELKSCFTDQGWQGYNDALTQSGNMNAVKTQKLTVSGQLQGKARVRVVKENQWSVNLPLQVVYQNDTEKLTQYLNIDLLVTRKISGELGIVQIIASPLGKPDEKMAK